MNDMAEHSMAPGRLAEILGVALERGDGFYTLRAAEIAALCTDIDQLRTERDEAQRQLMGCETIPRLERARDEAVESLLAARRELHAAREDEDARFSASVQRYVSERDEAQRQLIDVDYLRGLLDRSEGLLRALAITLSGAQVSQPSVSRVLDEVYAALARPSKAEIAARRDATLEGAQAALAASERRVADLRAAILRKRHRDYDGGPCWCWVDVSAGWRHGASCLELRALFAATAPPAEQPATEG